MFIKSSLLKVTLFFENIKGFNVLDKSLIKEELNSIGQNINTK